MEISYSMIHKRAAAIETVTLSSLMMTKECSDIDDCASDHDYVVLRAGLNAEHCQKAFHLSKDTCMMLWKSYIHGWLFNTDVLDNAQECGAKYITKADWDYPSTHNARTIVKQKDRKEEKTTLYFVDWLSHFSVQTTDKGIRTVAKQMFDQMTNTQVIITTIEERREKLSKYARGDLMKIIDKYMSRFYVDAVLSYIEFIKPNILTICCPPYRTK